MPEVPEITPQEIQAQQGTRLNQEVAPWMSYAAEMDEKLNPELAQAVHEYEQHRYDDKQTSAQNDEQLCMQREMNQEIAKEYQWLHPREYAEEGPRIGTVLSHDDFIGKLRGGCKLRCWYRDHPQPRKLTLLYGNPDGTADPQVACWVQAGYMPEFSFMRFDDHGVPLDERRRGWRTCLLQMILKGILTEQTVTRVFGAARGPASERYNGLLYEWRHQRLEAV